MKVSSFFSSAAVSLLFFAGPALMAAEPVVKQEPAKPAPAVKPAPAAAAPAAKSAPASAPAEKPASVVIEKDAKAVPAVKAEPKKEELKPAEKKSEKTASAKEEVKFVVEEEVTDVPAPVEDQKDVKVPAKKPAPPVYKRNTPIYHLIITANYQSPRMLAEMARKKYRVPYVLIPAGNVKPDMTTELAFIPADDSNSFVFKAKELSLLIAYLRPRNVVILGSDSYVHPVYRTACTPEILQLEYRDQDWKVNALKLSNELNRPELYKNFIGALKNKTVLAPEEAVLENNPGAALNGEAGK